MIENNNNDNISLDELLARQAAMHAGSSPNPSASGNGASSAHIEGDLFSANDGARPVGTIHGNARSTAPTSQPVPQPAGNVIDLTMDDDASTPIVTIPTTPNAAPSPAESNGNAPSPGEDAAAEDAAPQSEGEETAPQDDSNQSEAPRKKTIEEIIDENSVEEETQSPSDFSLRNALGGVLFLKMFRNQIPCIVVLALAIIAYITVRFQCQTLIIKADNIEKQIKKEHAKGIVFSAAITEKSRESRILEELKNKGDTTIVIPKEPPYKIQVPEEE